MTKKKSLWIEYFLNLFFIVFFYIKKGKLAFEFSDITFYIPIVIFFLVVLKTKKILHVNLIQSAFFISYMSFFRGYLSNRYLDIFFMYMFIVMIFIFLEAYEKYSKKVITYIFLNLLIVFFIITNGFLYSLNFFVFFRVFIYLTILFTLYLIIDFISHRKKIIPLFCFLIISLLVFDLITIISKNNIKNILTFFHKAPQLKIDSLILPDDEFLIDIDFKDKISKYLKPIDDDIFYLNINNKKKLIEPDIFKVNDILLFSNGKHLFDLEEKRLNNINNHSKILGINKDYKVIYEKEERILEGDQVALSKIKKGNYFYNDDILLFSNKNGVYTVDNGKYHKVIKNAVEDIRKYKEYYLFKTSDNELKNIVYFNNQNKDTKTLTFTDDEILDFGFIDEKNIFVLIKENDQINGKIIDPISLKKTTLLIPIRIIDSLKIDSKRRFLLKSSERILFGSIKPVKKYKYENISQNKIIRRTEKIISNIVGKDQGVRIKINKKTETIQVFFSTDKDQLSEIVKKQIELLFALYITLSAQYNEYGVVITSRYYSDNITLTSDMNLIKKVYYSRNSDTLSKNVMISLNENNIRFKGGI